MALKDKLRTARKAQNLSQGALAKLAGVSQQLISQIERGVLGAGKVDLPKIADALGLQVEALDPHYWRNHPAAQKARQAVSPSPPASGTVFPLYASVEGGTSGEMVLSNEPVEYRGHPLDNVAEAYLTYVVGDSMAPAFEQGDIVLVNPHAPPRPGNDVVLQTQAQMDTDHAQRAALVKRLIRATAEDWHLEQFNPAKKFKLRRHQWPICHVIVGKYSRR